MFDKRSNLYLFFIEKAIKHLKFKGELIFITPRDFLKSTSSIPLNNFIYKNGTITDYIDLGDKKIFQNYSPNCIIWRFEKDNFSRNTRDLDFMLMNGQLLFSKKKYTIKFSDVFYVKVGAVSGADKIFTNHNGNADFVCSHTRKTGKTRKMIYNEKSHDLMKFKNVLLKRKIKKFSEKNWWKWGRNCYKTNKKRIYVNCRTRNSKPFFTHSSVYYDGSVLGVFPINQNIEIKTFVKELNNVAWKELGFVCDGRYIFSQKSLENTYLSDNFKKYPSQHYNSD